MRKPLLFALTALTISSTSLASSPDAWDEHYRSVRDACLEQSALRDAKPASDLMVFSDVAGVTALLVKGKHARQGQVTLLCVWKRSNKRVEFQNLADGVEVPGMRAG